LAVDKARPRKSSGNLAFDAQMPSQARAMLCSSCGIAPPSLVKLWAHQQCSTLPRGPPERDHCPSVHHGLDSGGTEQSNSTCVLDAWASQVAKSQFQYNITCLRYKRLLLILPFKPDRFLPNTAPSYPWASYRGHCAARCNTQHVFAAQQPYSSGAARHSRSRGS
jgi:hypothetical protein